MPIKFQLKIGFPAWFFIFPTKERLWKDSWPIPIVSIPTIGGEVPGVIIAAITAPFVIKTSMSKVLYKIVIFDNIGVGTTEKYAIMVI